MTRLRAGTRIQPGAVASEAGSGGGSGGVEIFTLGGIRLFNKGEELTESLGGRRLALLVYLFHEQRPLSPFEIIELLGRGGDEETELEGLSRAVNWLKDNLGGVYIKMTSDTVEAVRGVWLDSREVDRAIDGRDAARVAELFQGDFLEGFESGSEEFDDWAAKERARIRRAWTNAILAEADRAESAGRWEQASAWWSILVSRLPTRGEAVAGLIRSYAMAQDDSSASLAYGEYLARLQQNGKGEPADAVLEVVNEFSVQQVDVGGHIVEEEYNLETEAPGEAGYDTQPDQATESGYEMELDGTGDSGYEIELDSAPEAGYEIDADTEPETDEVELDLGDAASEPAAQEEVVLEEPPIDLQATVEEAELRIEPDPGAQEPLDGLQLGSQVPDAAEGLDEPAEPELELGSEQLDSEPPAPGYVEGLEGNALADEAMLQPEISAEPELSPEPDALSEPEPLPEPEQLGEPDVLGEPAQPAEPEGLGEPEAPTASELQFDTPVDFAKPAEPAPAEPEPSFEPAAADELGSEWDEIVDFATPEEEIVIDEDFGYPVEGQDEGTDAVRGDDDFMDPSELGGVEERGRRGWDTPGLRSGYVSTPQPAQPTGSSALAGLQKVGKTAGSIVAGLAVAVGGAARLLGTLGGLVGKLRPRKMPSVSAPRLGLGSALRRLWYVPVVVLAVGAAVWAAPKLTAKLGSLKGDGSDGSGGDSGASVSLPKVTVPKVTVKTPSFVTTSVSKIGEMFSGPILEEPGASIIVADVIGLDGNPHRALTAALQADLYQATFFTAQERERLLLTSARRSEWALSQSEALRLALTRGDTLVLSGVVLDAGEKGDTIKVRVIDPQGTELHSAATVVSSDEQLLPALHATTASVRRRLGEPGDDVEASGSPVRVLSPSLEAIAAYDRARAALFNGRYTAATAAGEEAVRIDPDFATAHLLLAEAYALRGRRRQARRSLDTAWDHRERLTERDKLRVAADRLAFDRKYSDAIFAYDRVFATYRDDTRALKSQALMERMVGSRGSGLGNLKVAYSISPIDWPPLDRLARYLAYDGPRLPDVDSLVSSAGE